MFTRNIKLLPLTLLPLVAAPAPAQEVIVFSFEDKGLDELMEPRITDIRAQMIEMTNNGVGLHVTYRYEAPEGTILKDPNARQQPYVVELLEGNDYKWIPTFQTYSDGAMQEKKNELDSTMRVFRMPGRYKAYFTSALNVKYTTGTKTSPIITLDPMGGSYQILGVEIHYQHSMKGQQHVLSLSYEDSIPNFDNFIFFGADGKELQRPNFSRSQRLNAHEDHYRFPELPTAMQVRVDDTPRLMQHYFKQVFCAGAENLLDAPSNPHVKCDIAQIYTEFDAKGKIATNRIILLLQTEPKLGVELIEPASLQILNADGSVLAEQVELQAFPERVTPYPYRKPYSLAIPPTSGTNELIIQGELKVKVSGLPTEPSLQALDMSKPCDFEHAGIRYHIEPQAELESGIWRVIKISSPDNAEALLAQELPFRFADAAGKFLPAMRMLHADDAKGTRLFKFRNNYPQQVEIQGTGEGQIISIPLKQKIHFGLDKKIPTLRNLIK